jgi:hypothetical protein
MLYFAASGADLGDLDRVGVSLSSVRNRLGTPEVDKPGSVTCLLWVGSNSFSV